MTNLCYTIMANLYYAICSIIFGFTILGLIGGFIVMTLSRNLDIGKISFGICVTSGVGGFIVLVILAMLKPFITF